MIRIVTLGAIALAIAASGCGSDDSGDGTAPTVSVPAITSPLGTSTAGSTTTATPTPTTTKGGKTYNPSQPDSETNDVPPAPGSPQETFEKQCQAHPNACG